MSVIIFIVILSALIIVHELGHFLVAKKYGVRVDEFGLGFPPRVTTLFNWRGTPFTINWLPFGGFVKIFGENPSDEIQSSLNDNFQSKNRGIQASILLAGVVGNFLFGWFLISLGFMVGLPVPTSLSIPVENVRTVITNVLPTSPADIAGLKSGDIIRSLSRGDVYSELTPEAVSLFIADSPQPVIFTVERGGEISTRTLNPEGDIIVDRLAVGISMDAIGTVKLPPHRAIWYGLKTTSGLAILTGQSIGIFISQALFGKASLSDIAGPVGIIGMVGDARELGFIYLMTFTALLSVNLAVINLLPIPALDGGRLLFTGIEAATRRSISPRVFNTLNKIGFVLLVALMLLITVHDVGIFL